MTRSQACQHGALTCYWHPAVFPLHSIPMCVCVRVFAVSAQCLLPQSVDLFSSKQWSPESSKEPGCAATVICDLSACRCILVVQPLQPVSGIVMFGLLTWGSTQLDDVSPSWRDACVELLLVLLVSLGLRARQRHTRRCDDSSETTCVLPRRKR